MRRIYRDLVKTDGFWAFEVSYKQSNLFIKSCKAEKFEVFELLKKTVDSLYSYIEKRKEFLTSLEPIKPDKKAPLIANKMIEASKKAGVGPMAAVAGAIAEKIGKFLLTKCDECMVENGGDIFAKLNRDTEIGVYTNNSFFKDKINILIEKTLISEGIGIAASSYKIGPSLSKGKADLAVIIDKDAAFADALATATANMIKTENDLEDAVSFAKSKDILGCIFIKDKRLAVWGKIKLV